MNRTVLCFALILGLSHPPGVMASQTMTATDPEVLKGIKSVDDGDFDGAILILDNASRRLASDPARANDLSQAYLYLGIAYVGKGHEAAAKAKFREALTQIKDMTLSPDKYPPKVIDVFEAARQEAGTSASRGGQAKGGGGHKGLLIGAGIVAVGGGVAIAAASGGKGSQDNRRTDTFTGTLCGSTEICEDTRSYDIVVSGPGTLDATVTWGDQSIFFQMRLTDENFNDVAFSNRTSNTSSQLTAQVTPQRSTSSAAYHLDVNRPDSGGAVPFTLTVRHP